jgi:CBS domain-containing protein
MTPDKFAAVVFDAVMQSLLKALPGRVDAAVESRVAAMLEQIGTLATSVEKVNGAVVGYVTRTDLEATVARVIDSFTQMSRLEMQRIVSGLRIQSDAEGFLTLTNERDGVRAPLGFRPFQYHGTYDHEKKYLENDAVTNRGSLWIARARVSGVSPGTDDGAQFWTLAVKCGKDARANGGARDG